MSCFVKFVECGGDSKDSGFMTATILVLSIGNRSTKESILLKTLNWIQDKLHTSGDLSNHVFRVWFWQSTLYFKSFNTKKNFIYALFLLMFFGACKTSNDRERQNLYSRTFGHLIQENWQSIQNKKVPYTSKSVLYGIIKWNEWVSDNTCHVM